jgi:hypothetical protein
VQRKSKLEVNRVQKTMTHMHLIRNRHVIRKKKTLNRAEEESKGWKARLRYSRQMDADGASWPSSNSAQKSDAKVGLQKASEKRQPATHIWSITARVEILSFAFADRTAPVLL